MSESPPTPTPTPEPALDLTQALGQLRILICGLGAVVVVLSLSLNFFVWKQNRNTVAVTNNRRSQLSQIQADRPGIILVVNDLAKYSADKPELADIFKRHGIEITLPAVTAPANSLKP